MSNTYQLKIYPDAVLRDKSFPVLNFDSRLFNLIEGMKEIMYLRQGIGLAAPQVGVLQRVVITDIGEGLFTLVNPVILHRQGAEYLEEGCLSLPGVQVEIQRSEIITVSGLTVKGKTVEMELSGLMARVIQHEIDHLNGILIIDYQWEPSKQVKEL